MAQWSFDHAQAAGRGTTTLPGAARAVRAARVVGPDGRRPRAPAGRAGRLPRPRAPPPARGARRPDRGGARAARAGGAEPGVRGRGRGRAAPHGAAELALARHAHAARLDRGRGEHAAPGHRARPRRATRARGHDRPGIAPDGAAGRQPARHDPGGGRRAPGAEGVAAAVRRGRAWRCSAPRSSSAAIRSRRPFRPDLPLVPMDEILLEQVFVNLLENAAKHTPAGTPIEVGADEPAGRGGRVRRRPRAGTAARRGGADLPQVLSRRRRRGRHRPRPHHLPRHRHRPRRAHLGREPRRAAARSSGSRSRSAARRRSSSPRSPSQPSGLGGAGAWTAPPPSSS